MGHLWRQLSIDSGTANGLRVHNCFTRRPILCHSANFIYIHGSRLLRLRVYWVTRAQWDWDVRGWWKRGSSTWLEGPPCPHRIFFCLDFESRNVSKLCAHQTASSLVPIKHFAFCTVSHSLRGDSQLWRTDHSVKICLACARRNFAPCIITFPHLTSCIIS